MSRAARVQKRLQRLGLAAGVFCDPCGRIWDQAEEGWDVTTGDGGRIVAYLCPACQRRAAVSR